MIPYEGEEVKLVWANMDQYYIKTGEYLRDYSFFADAEKMKRVHFKLVEAEENKDNTKSTNGNRRFDLADEGPVAVHGNELFIRFMYRDVPKNGRENRQDAINTKTAVKSLLLDGFRVKIEGFVEVHTTLRGVFTGPGDGFNPSKHRFTVMSFACPERQCRLGQHRHPFRSPPEVPRGQ